MASLSSNMGILLAHPLNLGILSGGSRNLLVGHCVIG